jgi:putative chitinase
LQQTIEFMADFKQLGQVLRIALSGPFGYSIGDYDCYDEATGRRRSKLLAVLSAVSIWIGLSVISAGLTALVWKSPQPITTIAAGTSAHSQVTHPPTTSPPVAELPPPLAVDITPALLAKIMPDALQQDTWAAELTAAMRVYRINTIPRESAFLAQLAFQTGQLRHPEMPLYFTHPEKLMAIWPRWFPTTQSATAYLRAPQTLANYVFANWRGNREQGDGYLYRPRGMLRGRADYEGAAREFKQPFDRSPNLVTGPHFVSFTSAWEWTSQGESRAADAGAIAYLAHQVVGELAGQDIMEQFAARATKVMQGAALVQVSPLIKSIPGQ